MGERRGDFEGGVLACVPKAIYEGYRIAHAEWWYVSIPQRLTRDVMILQMKHTA
jgi:hypothetical protein